MPAIASSVSRTADLFNSQLLQGCVLESISLCVLLVWVFAWLQYPLTLTVIGPDRDPTMVLDQQKDFTGPHAGFSAPTRWGQILCVATRHDLGSVTYGLCHAGPIYAITHVRERHKGPREGDALRLNVLLHTATICTPSLSHVLALWNKLLQGKYKRYLTNQGLPFPKEIVSNKKYDSYTFEIQTVLLTCRENA